MHHLQLLKELAPYLMSVGAAFWVKRWITKTDKSIDKLIDNVQKINVQMAIYNESREHKLARIEEMGHRIGSTEKSIERLSANVESIWSSLNAKKASE